MWQQIISMETSMLILLREHFPLYWRIYPLIFLRVCGSAWPHPPPPPNLLFMPSAKLVEGIFWTCGFSRDLTGWPPCSPGLNPLDFFLRKCLCYTSTRSWQSDCILVAVTDIEAQPRQLVLIRDSIRSHCEACVLPGGRNLKHLWRIMYNSVQVPVTWSDICVKFNAKYKLKWAKSFRIFAFHSL
jgi:hypothetical protein